MCMQWREEAPPTQIPEQEITEPQEVWTVFVVVGRQLNISQQIQARLVIISPETFKANRPLQL